MELINKNTNNEIVVPLRKKREQEDHKTIFEIYRSPKTLKDYKFYLLKFLEFVYEGNSAIDERELIPLMVGIDEQDIERFISYLFEDRNLKRTSVNKILAALKSLYKEIEKLGYKDPFKFIKLFKVSRNLDRILKLSINDINKIIGLYKVNNDKTYRNIIILYTLFYTGMRSQEIIDLRFKDISERDGEGYIRLEKTKSGKEQYKPIHKSLSKKLDEYRKFVSTFYNINIKQLQDYYVFPSSFENNTKLSYHSLYDIIHNMGRSINKDISPHNVRHAVATELSLNGADLIEIRDFLGHSDTKVTEVYINARNILEKRAMDKLPDITLEDNDNK